MERYQHIRAFISAALDYSKHPSESATSAIQRSLGVISASLDLSVFDPGTSIAAEFYVSLYELMNSLGSRSTLIWSAVDVLQNACRNVPARQSLIHTYKFAPILARLLEANLTTEKRIRVLKLLQELTYGIKISWQEAHLPYLISILTQWVVQSKEEEIIALSLGVLVNLCYKNLPAVYTLMRTINTKAFIRTLLKLQEHVNTSVQCCKLLIILEPTNTNISEKYIMDFASLTFTNLRTAMKQKDVLLLRHIIDFFNDVGQNEHSRNVLLTYSNYGKDVENILATLEENTDPECIALMMEFLLSLVKLKLAALTPLYPACIKSAMTWVPVEQVCSKALALIRSIIIDSRRTKTSAEVLTEVDPSVLMLITNPEDETDGQNESQNVEMETKQAELMQLFQEMIKTPALKKKIMQSFSEHAMRRLFNRMLDNEFSAAGDWTGNFIQNASTNLYIHALALTADLATNHSNWLTLYSELLSRKQMQMVMALALFTGDGEVKQKVLQLTSSIGFPQECVSAVAVCMKELEPLMLVQSTNSNVLEVANKTSLNYAGNELAPLFSIAQEERLDAFLAKLESAFASNQINDIPTSAVMELYEYKLATMRHSERAMQSSLEAANNHGTSLQHRLAQVVAESSRLHQLLFDTQQCLEGIKAEKSILTGKLNEMEDQSKKAMFIKKQEIESLKKIVVEKSTNLEHLNEKLMQCSNELEASNNKIDILSKKVQELDNERLTAEKKATDMSNTNHELSKLLQKMKDSLSKKEQEPSRVLREALRSSLPLKDRLMIKLENDMRYGEVRFDHWLLHAKVVDLPTIVESLKTIDNKSFYKTADICQVVICKEEDDHTATDEESPVKQKKKDPNKVDKKFLWPHGITPPAKNVRRRRFRKTLKKKYVEAPEIEKEVKRLLREDNDAVNVKWEVICEDEDQSKPSKVSSSGTVKTKRENINGNTSQSLDVAEHDIFGEAVSDSEDDDEEANINVMELDENSHLTADSRVSDSNSMQAAYSERSSNNATTSSVLVTEFSKEMFQNDNNGDPETEKQQDEATSTKASKLEQFHAEYIISDNYTESPPVSVSKDSRLATLHAELAELRQRRQQQEIEIANIENVKLRQRFQEILDNLLTQEMQKVQEIQDLELE